MKDPSRLGRILEAMVKANAERSGDIPVTVKIRSGWDAASGNYAECGRIAAEAGAAMVSLHPRTRSQGYGGKSDWTLIRDLVSRLSIPVAGSGDLFTPEDAAAMLGETGCAAVMFARGAQGNPFIFRLTKEYLATGRWTPPPYEERFAMAFKQLDLLTLDMGEAAACREMRKAFCAYTKGICGSLGLKGSGKLRDRLVHAETISDYKTILLPGYT
jgi:nifR3 family TIM-barrel protein